MNKTDVLNQLIINYIECWNRHDVVGVIDCLSEDAVYENCNTKASYSGSSLWQYLQNILLSFADVKLKLIGDISIIKTDLAVIRLEVSAHQLLNEAHVKTEHAEFIEVSDGRIKSVKTYCAAWSELDKNNELIRVVNKYIACWNRHDAKAVANCFADDAVYEDTFMRERYRGKAIEQYIQSILEHDNDLSFQLVSDTTRVSNNRVAVQTLTSGFRPFDNDYFEVESAEFFEIEGGKIKALKAYYEGSLAYKSELARDVIIDYLDCWNRQDIEGIMAGFIEGGVYEDGVIKESYSGNGIREYIKSVFKEGSDLSFELISDISRVNDSRVVVQVMMSGYRYLDGTYFETESAEFYDIVDSKIKSIKVYYDGLLSDDKAEAFRQVVSDYLDCWNRHDSKAAAACFTADGVYEDCIMNQSYRAGAIEEYIQSTLGEGRDLKFELIEDLAVIGDNQVILKIMTSGYNNQDGTYFEAQSVEFFEMDGMKIKALKSYYEDLPVYDEDAFRYVVNKFLDAWNRHDSKAIADCFTEDGLYEDCIEQQSYSGKDIQRSAENVFQAGNNLKFELVEDFSLVSDNQIILKILTSGYNVYDGSYFEIEGADFLEIEGDKIKSLKSYYESFPSSDKAISPNSKSESSEASKKYQRSGLCEDQEVAYKQKLLNLMEKEKAFKDNEITMPVLADAMGLSINHLSQVINTQFEMNFFDFINHYRIAEAKILLVNLEGHGSDSILEVALMVGFNSTSTFYNAFKKFTGMSPVKFKKNATRRRA